jgi:hypothetical protein
MKGNAVVKLLTGSTVKFCERCNARSDSIRTEIFYSHLCVYENKVITVSEHPS